MRYLGIDFGTKKIGLSLSDEEGNMAFPLSIIEVSPNLFSEVMSIIKKEEVEAVVMGDSRDFQGQENPMMEKVHIFKTKLEEAGLKVYLESELFSSKEAGRIQGYTGNIDASAATIILQSFLDKQKN